ncbi:MAG: sugar phosphate isomerase/epimerase [Calditrichaeota bacterium]|nr:MAG: sugar phosphate isomerase/epimerase [Calditrichota bacterium]
MKLSTILTILLLGTTLSTFAGDFPNEVKVGGFAIGPQMWSFRLFTFAEGVYKAKEAGSSVIEAFPGQNLCPHLKSPFDHNADPAVWAHAKLILEKAGVRLVNYGVVGWKDEAEMERVFVFAKLMGIPAISIEPGDHSPAGLDAIEKMIKKYNIQVGIHNHPVQINNPDYIYWNPDQVLELVDGRDPRFGLACDTGHWLRSGVNPLEALKKAKGRIISVHLKDLNEIGNVEAHDVPYGKGVANIDEILQELKRQNFSGNISIEYETNWENNVPEIKECIDFVLKADNPF